MWELVLILKCYRNLFLWWQIWIFSTWFNLLIWFSRNMSYKWSVLKTVVLLEGTVHLKLKMCHNYNYESQWLPAIVWFQTFFTRKKLLHVWNSLGVIDNWNFIFEWTIPLKYLWKTWFFQDFLINRKFKRIELDKKWVSLLSCSITLMHPWGHDQ